MSNHLKWFFKQIWKFRKVQSAKSANLSLHDKMVCAMRQFTGPLKRAYCSGNVALNPKPFSEVPGPRRLPLIGTLYLNYTEKEYRKRAPYVYTRWAKEKYGPIFRIKMLGLDMVIVTDPADAETILKNDDEVTHFQLYFYILSWKVIVFLVPGRSCSHPYSSCLQTKAKKRSLFKEHISIHLK